MMSMMPAFWSRIFLVSLATVAVAKLLGSSYSIVALFLMACVGWTVVLLGLLQVERLVERLRSTPRKGQDPPAT